MKCSWELWMKRVTQYQWILKKPPWEIYENRNVLALLLENRAITKQCNRVKNLTDVALYFTRSGKQNGICFCPWHTILTSSALSPLHDFTSALLYLPWLPTSQQINTSNAWQPPQASFLSSRDIPVHCTKLTIHFHMTIHILQSTFCRPALGSGSLMMLSTF